MVSRPPLRSTSTFASCVSGAVARTPTRQRSPMLSLSKSSIRIGTAFGRLGLGGLTAPRGAADRGRSGSGAGVGTGSGTGSGAGDGGWYGEGDGDDDERCDACEACELWELCDPCPTKRTVNAFATRFSTYRP